MTEVIKGDQTLFLMFILCYSIFMLTGKSFRCVRFTGSFVSIKLRHRLGRTSLVSSKTKSHSFTHYKVTRLPEMGSSRTVLDVQDGLRTKNCGLGLSLEEV